MWVYAREPDHRPDWRNELDDLGATALRSQPSLATRVRGVAAGLGVLWPLLQPRRVALVVKEAGLVRTGVDAAIATHRPHVVFLASPYAALVEPRKMTVPVVYNSMDALTFAIDNGSYGATSGLRAAVRRAQMDRFDRYACNGKDIVVFVTERDAREATHAWNIAVVSNGADVGRFGPASPDDAAAAPTVLFQGSPRYPPNRRAIELIVADIAPRVWHAVPTAVFRFVGGGNEFLRDGVGRSDGRLDFAGYVDDLGAEWRRAWVALAPIEHGAGIKNKVLDAMARACRSWGCPRPSRVWRVRRARSKHTHRTISREVIELLQDPERRRHEGVAARRYAESVAWPRQVGRYVEVWRQTAADSGEARYR